VSVRAFPVTLAWFGKLPGHGDFLRSSQQGLLTQRLDQWLAQGLDLMAADSRWKQIYDQARGTPFALFGVQGRAMLVGYLQPSTDLSGRRYPFVLTGAIDMDGAAGQWVLIPLLLERLWGDLEQLCRAAHDHAEPVRHLAEAAQREWQLVVDAAGQQASWQDFLEDQTLGALEALLRRGGHPTMDLHRAMVALGLLLQPVPASGVSSLDRG
jgi:type VI secretion system protein ImpM